MEPKTLPESSDRRERLNGRQPLGQDEPPSVASVVLPDEGPVPLDIAGVRERTTGSRVSRKRLVRLFRFGLVGMSGLLVNQMALWALTEIVGVHYLLSAVVATQASTVWNFALTERWVFRASRNGRARRFMWFAGINNVWLAARTPLLFALTDWVGVHYLISNIVALTFAMLARFFVADTWIWTGEEPRRVRRFLYDIHGIVRIASAARLPELGAFRVQVLDGPADLQLTISNRGFGGLRRRSSVETKGQVTTYVEHLGGLGFAARLDMATPIGIQASRFLRRSPHVLYTNIVEPTLRWLFVRKGYALAHAACVEVAGKGLLITAQTDTGKTTTCLRSIRAHGARFLSDDMTILTPEGGALSYPKPLTISAHTLRAVRGAPLPWWRWPWLLVQGRVHSKGGRRFGMWLARQNLPVGTISALIQMVVPPPKFFVEQLIPGTETKPTLPLTHMISIERGGESVQELSLDEACRVLLANTEDAYGFPPYPLIAGGLHNEDAPIEGAIQRSVLVRVALSRIRSPDRNWFERIPPLIGQSVVANGTDAKLRRALPSPLREPHLSGSSELGQSRPQGLRSRAIARVVLPLVGIFAVAIFLRTWRLGAVGFGGDEAVYAGQASVLAENTDAERFFVLMSRGNSNFLFFQHVVSIFYRVFGVSDVVARLVAVGFSSATVLLAYALGRLLYGRVTGLVAAALLAVSGYAVALGRLAFLDSALTFLFALTMVSFVVWDRTRKPIWLCLAAAASALTVQAKLTGALVLVAMATYLLISRRFTRLRPTPLLVAGVTFLFFLLPAAVQLVRHWNEFWLLLADSSHRFSQADWAYYIRTLVRYDGYLLPFLWLVGAGFALRRRRDGDKLLLVWVGAVVVFHQLYPLKAFNYLLPAMPAFCVMAAEALRVGARKLAVFASGVQLPRRIPVPQVASVILLPGLLGVGMPPLEPVLKADDFAGLREAAFWLKERAEPDAGVMVLSNGSAQYTFSFYAGLDAYPFGRFRLATVLPGGEILRPGPTPAGRAPTDWVSNWPPWLIEDGKISYLVFHTTEGDDPPENPIVNSANQRDFQALVEAYGGELVHREYHEHEARVWVYRVTKLLPTPRLRATWLHQDPVGPGSVRVSGRGFHIDSTVAFFFHGQGLGIHRTDGRGRFSTRVALGENVEPRHWLLVRDLAGNEGSVPALDIKERASGFLGARFGSRDARVLESSGPSVGGVRPRAARLNFHPCRRLMPWFPTRSVATIPALMCPPLASAGTGGSIEHSDETSPAAGWTDR
jgi:putative flippase GtrA